MNKIYYTIGFLALVSTPVYAHDTCPNPSDTIRVKKVETFPSNSRRDRSFQDFQTRNPRVPTNCVTKQITDEYGYVHYFQTCSQYINKFFSGDSISICTLTKLQVLDG